MPRRLVRARRNTTGDIFVGRLQVWAGCTTVAATIDFVAGATEVEAKSIVAVAGTALVLGLALGALDATAVAIARRLPLALRTILWAAIFAGAFTWLAGALGAFESLRGRHVRLAVAVLGVCAAGVLGATALALAVQPRAGTRATWLARQSRGLRRLFTLAVVGGAAAAVVADRTLFPSLYPDAHRALQVCALWLAASACFAAGKVVRAPRSLVARAGVSVALAGIAVAPFVLPFDEELSSAIGSRSFPALCLDVVREGTDFDGDGFSGVLGGGDCGPFDASVHPVAREIPDNGVDDNCRGGDARTHRSLVYVPPPIPTRPSPVDVVLVTIDTVRAERMSVYGHERDTTPNIARWAAEATRFDAAYTAGLWTTISIPSLMRGVYPRHLSWSVLLRTNRGTQRASEPLLPDDRIKSKFVLPFDDPHLTLAELLQRRGMHTVAVVDDGGSDLLDAEWGFGRGFDEYHVVGKSRSKDKSDAATASLAIARLDAHDERPYFLWAHFFGPHEPSTVHDDVPVFGETAQDAYDHELVYMDRQVGRLLDAVARTARPTVVIVTSDHGEHFSGTRGRSHGKNILEGSVRVPLIVKAPAMAPAVVDAIVSTVDILPTVLALTQTPPPPFLDGIDLASVVADPAASRGRILLVDSFIYDKHGAGRFRFDLAGAIDQDHKLSHEHFQATTKFLQRGTDRPAADRAAKARLRAVLDDYLESTGGLPQLVP
jgi:arylsulfatase A-like enzyme